MKVALKCLMFGLLFCQCNGQINDLKVLNRIDSSSLKFRQYAANKCLAKVLDAIVESEVRTGFVRYPTDMYYFNLLITESPSYTSLLIIPRRWNKDMPRDCHGLIDVKGRSFVCCGDCNKTRLIADTKIEVEKIVSFKSSSIYDSLDRVSGIPNWEKSPTRLLGMYRDCQEKPIELYIDIGKEIKGISIKK